MFWAPVGTRVGGERVAERRVYGSGRRAAIALCGPVIVAVVLVVRIATAGWVPVWVTTVVALGFALIFIAGFRYVLGSKTVATAEGLVIEGSREVVPWHEIQGVDVVPNGLANIRHQPSVLVQVGLPRWLVADAAVSQRTHCGGSAGRGGSAPADVDRGGWRRLVTCRAIGACRRLWPDRGAVTLVAAGWPRPGCAGRFRDCGCGGVAGGPGAARHRRLREPLVGPAGRIRPGSAHRVVARAVTFPANT